MIIGAWNHVKINQIARRFEAVSFYLYFLQAIIAVA